MKPEFKQRLRRRLRKCHLKSEFALPQTFNELIPPRLIPQMLENFSVQLNSDSIKVQENKKKVVVLCSRPRQNVKLGTLTL